MRAVILVCFIAVVALVTAGASAAGPLPEQQHAAALPESSSLLVGGGAHDRQLLENADAASTQPAAALDGAADPAVKRTSTASTIVTPVVVAPTATTATIQQQPAARAAGGKDGKQRGARAGSNSALGRKGGPFRQAGGGGGGQVVDTNGDPVILPGCSPRDGVYCVDQDYYSFLKVQPGYIGLQDAYPYTETKPTAEAGVETKSNLDLATDSFDTATTASTKGGLTTKVGTEGVSGETEVANTLAATKVDGSRLEALQPDKITVNLDATDVTGTYDWRTFNPKYTVVLGQNFGLLNGLDTVSDGRKK